MKIGIASTGRSLAENVYKRFGNSPVFLIYETESKELKVITNFAKYNDGCGTQAAQIFADHEIDCIIVNEIDEKSLSILKSNNIEIYNGYYGSCFEALEKLENKKLQAYGVNKSEGTNHQMDNSIIGNSGIARFKFLDLELTFRKEFVPYFDWCMILHQLAESNIPSNWISPINFSDGLYHLNLQILEMKEVKKPIEFEFGWCNFPEEDHKNIPHRCNFGIYSSFTNTGTYEHIAKLKDMENTSVDGREEIWQWKKGWDSPFGLIKPYEQEPFPVKVKFTVTIYPA